MNLSVDEVKQMNAANLKAARARELGIDLQIGTFNDLFLGMLQRRFVCDQHFGHHWPEDDCVNIAPLSTLDEWRRGK